MKQRNLNGLHSDCSFPIVWFKLAVEVLKCIFIAPILSVFMVNSGRFVLFDLTQVCSLKSPQQGDSNDHTQPTYILWKTEILSPYYF